jgi:hypothetical protein
MKILIAIFLALFPIFSWIGQYFFSKKNNLINSFKKHWTCYYWDWIFIIINVVFIYSIELSNIIYIFLLISIVINLFTHYIWWKENIINKSEWHFFYYKTNKLNGAWIIHLIFSIIELTIFLSILFLNPIFPFIFIELWFIIIFWILIILWSYKIHWKINRMDLITSLWLISFTIWKIIFFVIK